MRGVFVVVTVMFELMALACGAQGLPGSRGSSADASLETGGSRSRDEAGSDARKDGRVLDAEVEAAQNHPTVDGGICTSHGERFPQGAGYCSGAGNFPCTAGCECAVMGNMYCECGRAVVPEAGLFCVSTNCGSIQCGSGCVCVTGDGGGVCDCSL
jgi:hypothetical protein